MRGIVEGGDKEGTLDGAHSGDGLGRTRPLGRVSTPSRAGVPDLLRTRRRTRVSDPLKRQQAESVYYNNILRLEACTTQQRSAVRTLREGAPRSGSSRVRSEPGVGGSRAKQSGGDRGGRRRSLGLVGPSGRATLCQSRRSSSSSTSSRRSSSSSSESSLMSLSLPPLSLSAPLPPSSRSSPAMPLRTS